MAGYRCEVSDEARKVGKSTESGLQNMCYNVEGRVRQLIGNKASFARCRAPEALIVGSDPTATKLVEIPFSRDKYLSVRAEWFSLYITNG